jgi:hypothetical protein
LAERELQATVDLLESEQPGTGLELLSAVETAIMQVCQFPESAPIASGLVRAKLVLPSSRLPYTVFYRIKPDHIRVLALGHHRRHPFYWLSRR